MIKRENFLVCITSLVCLFVCVCYSSVLGSGLSVARYCWAFSLVYKFEMEVSKLLPSRMRVSRLVRFARVEGIPPVKLL